MGRPKREGPKPETKGITIVMTPELHQVFSLTRTVTREKANAIFVRAAEQYVKDHADEVKAYVNQ